MEESKGILKHKLLYVLKSPDIRKNNFLYAFMQENYGRE